MDGERGLSGLARDGDDAQLLHHAQLVVHPPVLHRLAAREAGDVHPRDGSIGNVSRIVRDRHRVTIDVHRRHCGPIADHRNLMPRATGADAPVVRRLLLNWPLSSATAFIACMKSREIFFII